MTKSIILLCFCILLVSPTFGQNQHSGYSGQETREIKSLSQHQIEGYLNAKGMGFAKAAELNHYPGPKHVLELSEALDLTEEQVQRAKAFYNEMFATASELGKEYVQKEKELDALFSEKTVTEGRLNTLLLELGKINSQIRFAHLRAHLQMKEVLSKEQIQKYDKNRGYHQNK